ncbi:pilus assembly protein [Roseibium litorale]|uniref:TadE/TadG family protein n=1 Tax=Roseibium litorale TaxID=2803841 RepID=A0ABR9CLB9_9HYPH|nr:pilus assembly protein [Roseibium litorale]MBD8891652.1 TadE/TadG family protein [Roseibium litorale]
MRSGAARKLWKACWQLPANDRGSILPIFALLSFLVIVIAGAGVDFARAISEREAIATALDGAALTVATQLSSSVMSNEQIDKALKDAFRANASHVTDVTKALSDLTFVVDSEAGTVTVQTKATVPTMFIGLGGIGPKELSVNTLTQVSYSKFDVELALVLDVTGSMAGDMEALKDASLEIINTLLPDTGLSSDSKVRISIIPYSQGVNLGEFAQKVTNGDKGTRNCVTERLGAAKYTDQPYNYTPPASENLPTKYFGGGDLNSCAPSPQMEPLTSKKNKLTSAIGKLNATGATAGQTGATWGWYSLSPNWSNVWPKDSEPAQYSDKKTLKFAVIMTDGDNNRYYDYDAMITYSGRYWWGGYYSYQKKCPGWCEVVEGEYYDNVSSTTQRKICKAMDEAGITVYGVYFGDKGDSTGAKNMSACASDPDSYYMASSSADLINAFGNIARKIQAIYLAK